MDVTNGQLIDGISRDMVVAWFDGVPLRVRNLEKVLGPLLLLQVISVPDGRRVHCGWYTGGLDVLVERSTPDGDPVSLQEFTIDGIAGMGLTCLMARMQSHVDELHKDREKE